MAEEESLLSVAKQHFKESRGELKSVTVPEWNDSEIYYYSAPSVDEFIKISNDIAGGNQTEAMLTAFILYARKADATRHFGEHNRNEIRANVDARIVTRVVNQMGVFASLFEADDEEEAKND